MRKLISILASLTLVASSSSAVVSCASSKSKNKNNSLANNNLNNIVAASFEKGKQVIINNEYGIDSSIVKGVQSTMNVSDDNLSGIDYGELSNKQNSTVSDLVNQYYGSDDNTNGMNKGSNVNPGGTTGVTGSLDYIMKKVMDFLKINPVIQNVILNSKDLIMSWLDLNKDTVNLGVLNNAVSEMYDQATSGMEYLPNQLLSAGIGLLGGKISSESDSNGTFHKIGKAILDVLNDRDTFALKTLPGVFNSGVFKTIRTFMSKLFVKGTNQSVMQDLVYGSQVPDFSSMFPSDDNKNQAKLADAGETVTAVANIKVEDIKNELLASADRILKLVFRPEAITAITTGDSNFAYKSILGTETTTDPNLQKNVLDLQTMVTALIKASIDGRIRTVSAGTYVVPYKTPDNGKGQEPGDDWIGLYSPSKDLTSTNTIGQFIWEGFRDVTILNAQFSIFENANGYGSQDSGHLFGDINKDTNKVEFQQNYDFLNSLYGKTLGDFDYVNTGDDTLKLNDEPINLNYFFSNLNYFLGDLSNKDDEAAYRFQKLLFIALNDPTDPTKIPAGKNIPDNWNSVLLNFGISLGLNIASNALVPKDGSKPSTDPTDPYNIVNDSLINDPANVYTIENTLLKPILLGLTNGDNFQTLFETLIGGLEGTLTIPEVSDLINQVFSALGIDMQDIIDSLNRLIDDGIGNDTIHNLFTDDFRNVLQPLSFIPQSVMDVLFGENDPVNLFTLLNIPLNKILSLLNVPGFTGGAISPIGDYFTTKSIPQLVNFINNFINGLYGFTPGKYIVKNADGTVDYSSSLKARDINFIAIDDLYNGLFGDGEDAKEDQSNINKQNIISLLLEDLISANVPKDVSQFSSLSLKFDPNKLVTDLGLVTTSDSGGDSTKSLFSKFVKDGDGGDTPSGQDTDLKTVTLTADATQQPGNTIVLDSDVTLTQTTLDNTDLTVKSGAAGKEADNDVKSIAVSGKTVTLTLTNALSAKDSVIVTPKQGTFKSDAAINITVPDVAVPTLGKGVYDDSAKTITFKDAKNIKSPKPWDGKSKHAEGDVWVTAGLTGPQIASATYADGTGLVLTFNNSLEQENASNIIVHYQGPEDAITASVDIPSLYAVVITITKQSFLGSIYRAFLPMIDKDSANAGKDTFVMDKSYLKVDLFQQNWVDMVNLLDYFNSPARYANFVQQILENDKAFSISFNADDAKNISYFSNNNKLIKQIKFKITFKNYTVGTTNEYLFTVSRNSNLEGFKITDLVTNKLS